MNAIRGDLIDFELFVRAKVDYKHKILEQVSQNANRFDLATKQTLIDHALHDPDATIRSTACQLAREWGRKNQWRWAPFEHQVYQMAFHDPAPDVRRPAVMVARLLFWPAFIQQWGLFFITYILIASLFWLVFLRVGNFSGTFFSPTLQPCANVYVDHVVHTHGVQSDSKVRNAPDGNFAILGSQPNSYMVLDMGENSPIFDGAGADFYLYERPYGPGIHLDAMQLSVSPVFGATDRDFSTFTTVFVWGDNFYSNNGSIPEKYFPDEIENLDYPVAKEDLYNQTGIGIDIGNDDNTAYRYVLIQTYPPEKQINDPNFLVEIDAIQRVCPVLTPIPFATETPTNTEILQPPGTPSLTEDLLRKVSHRLSHLTLTYL